VTDIAIAREDSRCLQGTGSLIKVSLEAVQRRITAAAARAGRDPGEVTLVAVTKTFPIEVVEAGYQAGIRHFGENRVEEGAEKIPAVNAWVGAQAAPVWHMVGHLQSRKAGDAVALFQVIHSVDSVRLARRLERFCAQAEASGLSRRLLPILLEVNVSGEASKYGFAAGAWESEREQREVLFAAVAEIKELPHLRLQGMMTMAPIVSEPEEARPYFRRLRIVRDTLVERFPYLSWEHLSMGMTDDFEVAVEEGATLVRIGRAIFGERKE
jgi:pyridoxal phosphate enzyme (YggS family)